VKLEAAGNLESAIEQALARGELDRAEALAQEYRAATAGDSLEGLSSRFRACHLAARVALATGRLEQARERLTELLPLPDEVPSELAWQVELMLAEVHARTGADDLARGRLIRAQVHAGVLADKPLLKLDELRVRLWLGQVERMGEELAACDRALENCGDSANRALLACDLGRAWEAKGCLDRAGDCLSRAEQWSERLGTDAWYAELLIQLGRLEHLRGNHEAAQGRYETALKCPVSRPLRQEAALRRLLVLLDLGQWEEAHAGWELALDFQCPERLDQELRPLGRMVQALVERVHDSSCSDALARARALHVRALGHAEPSVRQAWLLLAQGRLALAANVGTDAKTWLGEARKRAGQEGLREVLWRSLEALGEIAAEIEGDDGRAGELFERAVVLAETQPENLSFHAHTHANRRQLGTVARRLLRGACRRGDAAAMFGYQEAERFALAPKEWWPTLLGVHNVAEFERVLPVGTVCILATLIEDECFFLVCRRGRRAQVIRTTGSALRLVEQVTRWRSCLDGQLERHRRGLLLGQGERDDLDGCLEELGRGCLGSALWEVLDSGERSNERVVWVPDGILHAFPLHALRRDGQYLIEAREVVYTLCGSFFVHHVRSPVGWQLPRALVLSQSTEVMSEAGQESEGVAATFWSSQVLHSTQAGLGALRQHLHRASVLHLDCQAYSEPEQPLSSRINLPSGETWYAKDWRDEPLDGLPLVTLPACHYAGSAGLSGREALGLVGGLLGSGVRSVLVNLWPVPDCEASKMVRRFYRERMTSDPCTALAQAQREALRQNNSSPLFWAAFALFGDPQSLPAPSRWLRWLARWRQARHARRFPTGESEGSS
jgi:tetratricopeptide (TPR) repeat protein